MVNWGSPIRTLADLAGKRFAFGAPLSTSSYLVPRAMFLDTGLGGENISCRCYQHHVRAARAVLAGEVEACGVGDIVSRKFLERGLQGIAQSGPVPSFRLVLSPRADGLRPTLLAVFLKRPRLDGATAALKATRDEELSGGFAPVSPDAYLPPRHLARRVFPSNVLTRPEAELACAGGAY